MVRNRATTIENLFRILAAMNERLRTSSLEEATKIAEFILAKGDDIITIDSGKDVLNPYYILNRSLERLKRENGHMDLLMSAIPSAPSICVLVYMVDYYTRSEQGKKIIPDPEQQTALRQAMLERIRKESATPAFWNHPKLMFILGRWYDWVDDKTELRKLVEKHVRTDESLLAFLENHCISRGRNSDTHVSHQWIDRSFLGKYLDVRQTEDRLKEIMEESGETDENGKKARELITIFRNNPNYLDALVPTPER